MEMHKRPGESAGFHVYGWQRLRWQPDVPPAEEDEALLASATAESLAVCGSVETVWNREEECLEILVAYTRFPALVHQQTALWLGAHQLIEELELQLEQAGTIFAGDILPSREEAENAAQPVWEISEWWARAALMDRTVAHSHRTSLQTHIKRRQYASLGGYVSRALRAETDPGRVCFAFVPLVVEAVWYRHPEASLKEMTRELSLKEMARHPKEGLLHWLNSLPGYLRTLPAETDAAPISRVVESIRMDCSLPYTQRNLSRSLGLTPAYFCRLFRDQTGQHFSTFLTAVRMDRAQTLLSAGEAPTLQALSQACGYPNKSYFCQVFKRYTGLTPGEYAQAVRQTPPG